MEVVGIMRETTAMQKPLLFATALFEAMLCGQMGQNLVVWRKNVTTHHDYNFILNVKQDGGVSQL